MLIIKTFVKLLLGRGIGSQFGEDEFLLSILPDKGTYVDVGCYHPHLYSNTYKLYKRGWRGVAIDPNPDMALLWRIFRPLDHFINAAVGSGGYITYYRYQDGAYNGFGRLNKPIKDQVHIQTIPLTKLIPPNGIDFLNIDAEGMDIEILKSHDWKTKPTVIAVEGHTSDTFLKQKGYHHLITLGETSIFSL